MENHRQWNSKTKHFGHIYDSSFARERLSRMSLGEGGLTPPRLLRASLVVSKFIIQTADTGRGPGPVWQ